MSRALRHTGGYTVILSTLLFIAITAIILFGLARPVLAAHSSAAAFEASTHAFLAGNSAAEEALYRLKTGKELDATETVTLTNASAQIAVSDTGSGKQVRVDAASGAFERDIEVEISQGEGASFHYGLQAGKGGFIMSGGAGIYGNVYSNGDIIGSGGPFITGSATVANASDPAAEVSNAGAFPPTAQIDFGGNATPQDMAQSFEVSTSTPVTSVRFYIKKSTTGWMNNITLRLTTDNGGKPAKTTLATANISAGAITTSFNYLGVPFTSTPTLTPGTTYWLVFDTGTTWGAYYSIAAAGSSYAGGVGKTGTWSNGSGGTWNNTSPTGLDAYFDVYVGGDTGLISGVNIGSAGGDAWAHEVNNSNVTGTIYCQASSGNNKACNTSLPDPVEQPFPISDGNILDWKAQATAGGVTVGNVTYQSDDTGTLGPQKIEGDLTVGGGGVLDITGVLYVTGDISVTGGGIVRLHSSYGGASGIIVSDGQIDVGGGGQFQGSGTAGSYILVVTTSQCPVGCGENVAIDVSGGSGSVVLNAQQGTIEFSGGAAAKQATGHTIEMSGGATVSYETGLADISFSSGPSGGWNLLNWQEL